MGEPNEHPRPRLTEIIFAGVATGVLVLVHLSHFENAGALWRDEINTVNLATMPLGEFVEAFEFDSYPVAWFGVVRAWAALSPGGTDQGLRLLGLLCGLGVLALLWWNARILGDGVPMVSLMLIGFCPALIRYGDCLRAFGFGIALILATAGMTWRVVEKPTAARLILLGALALASVQALYYNAPLLFALLVAGAAVSFRQRDPRKGVALLGVGVLAASSLLVYLPVIAHTGQWNVGLKAGGSPRRSSARRRRPLISPMSTPVGCGSRSSCFP